MPLPIEVNHVLGRRSLTLAYRDVDAPITIGRSRDCDVQIPSVSVGAWHCMLFVHEGQWLLQEAPNAAVTVNGAAIAGPVLLQIGDVIAIGPGDKPPTIQIDPAGAAAGRSGPAVETDLAGTVPDGTSPAAIGAAPRGKVRPPKPTPIAGKAPPQLSKPKLRPARPTVVPLAPPPDPGVDYEPPAVAETPEEYAPNEAAPALESGEPDGDTIDFGQAAAATSTYRRRPKPASSGAGGMIALFVAVLIAVGGVIWWAWQRHQAMLAALPHDQPPPKVVVIPPPTPKPKHEIDNSGDAGKSMFDIPHSKPAAVPAPAPAPPTPPSPPSPPSPPDDTGAPATPPTPPAQSPATPPANTDTSANDSNDTEWQAMRAAHIGPDQADALVKYDNYSHANPGKHAKELAQFENEALDQLWWQHVLGLFNKRADLDKQIAKQKDDLGQQPDDAYKKTMQADLAKMQEKRDRADQELTGKFGYTLPTPPDLDDPDALAALDAKRDPDMFAKWKQSTMKWIVEHEGQTPWANE